jgi:hypothetical protein
MTSVPAARAPSATTHRGSATEAHEPFASPQIGWAEQRPEDWWSAAARRSVSRCRKRTFADLTSAASDSLGRCTAVMLTPPATSFAPRSSGDVRTSRNV